MTFWNDVKQHTGTHNWQFAMYRENWFDKIDNFLIIDNYPKKELPSKQPIITDAC